MRISCSMIDAVKNNIVYRTAGTDTVGGTIDRVSRVDHILLAERDNALYVYLSCDSVPRDTASGAGRTRPSPREDALARH